MGNKERILVFKFVLNKNKDKIKTFNLGHEIEIGDRICVNINISTSVSLA